jgi:hypothetical protein
VCKDSEDKLWWVSSKKGVFKVKSFFYSLASSGCSPFPWKNVWHTQAPSRAAFFAWTVALGKILTLDNLRKRHVIVINRCFMCKKTEEFVGHLLLHRDLASILWSSLFICFGMSWVMTPICLFWCLWRDRNSKSFEDLESTLEEILSSFYHSLYFWTTAYVHPLSIYFPVFLIRFSLSN